MSFDTVLVKAPAKINLSLDIVSKRFDGYHNVAMVLQSVSLYDEVEVSLIEGNDDIVIKCSDNTIPLDSKNIVYKAAKAFYNYTKENVKPIEIKIIKNIPSQAGLAGGSSDGAAVILALNKIYNTHLSLEQMCEIGATVGADVPFCLIGGTALATETGTKLKKITNMPRCHILICKPQISVSTKEAYSLCDKRPPKGFLYTDEVVKMIYRHDLRGMCSCLYNEFEEVLKLDEITEIKRIMLKNKALGASMSGSGSAVYGIFDSEKTALRCMDKMCDEYNNLYICDPIKDGCKIE